MVAGEISGLGCCCSQAVVRLRQAFGSGVSPIVVALAFTIQAAHFVHQPMEPKTLHLSRASRTTEGSIKLTQASQQSAIVVAAAKLAALGFSCNFMKFQL